MGKLDDAYIRKRLRHYSIHVATFPSKRTQSSSNMEEREQSRHCQQSSGLIVSSVIPTEGRRSDRTRGSPNYRARAAGFFCFGRMRFSAAGVAAVKLWRSIHSSSKERLKRHRFPSLNAGIKFSDAYLYRLSALIPRYSAACRISITSLACQRADAMARVSALSRSSELCCELTARALATQIPDSTLFSLIKPAINVSRSTRR